MDWWTPGIGGGQRAVGALLGAPIDQATCGSQLDVTGTIFDPWLNTDDLDLGTILSQATNAPTTTTTTIATATNTTTTDTLGSVASLEQKTAAAIASNQTTPAGQQHLSSSSNSILQHQSQAATTITSRQTATHSRLSASDNKRHIINIINNSSASNQGQQHPIMGLVSRRDAAGSIAGSPLSSSLGSSPPNTQANYLSSPHSSLSPPQTLKQSYGDITTNNQNSRNDDNNNNNDSTSSTKPYITVQLQQNHHHNQQQQTTANYFPEVYLIEGADHDTNLAFEDQSNQGQPQGGVNTYTMQASVAGRPQLVYQDNMIVVACSQQQQQQQRATGRGITTSVGGRTNCGSSLLSALPSSSMNLKQNTKQNGARRLGTKGHNFNKQQQASSNGAASNQQLQQQPQKMRRCRHITDYVLAEEEKRLLIKEGHADFPMTCQARPLTKNEERILRKIRRKIRNKKSAQCSRQRKKEYVEELERKYAAVVRENEELRQLLAGDMNVETKFIEQLDIDGSNQERLHNHHHQQPQQQEQQQRNTLHHNHNNHHQQQTLFDDNQQQQQQIASQNQDENFLNSSQSSNGALMDQMSWKDLFPGTQQQRQ